MVSLAYKFVDSPDWKAEVGCELEGSRCYFVGVDDSPRRVRLGELTEDVNRPRARQDGAAVEGVLRRRTECVFLLPLDIRGTSFQCSVWETLLAIPFGETRSYGQLAKQLGNPQATRAVGAANGRNPISIVVPCHRVIGVFRQADGIRGRP